MKYKPLPIGIENFEDMITNGYYYIDKILFIKEIIDKSKSLHSSKKVWKVIKHKHANLL